MCGIAGFISQNGGEARPTVERILPALARRGPNAEGLNTWPGAALGHRRLAILDLSEAGNQPMIDESGAVGLVFNGCIYNFREIRRELESKGHRFRSQCDTEVILRGYLEFGIQALLPRLRGMFAFAIWDSRSEELHLVRDRLGVKPLLYAQDERGLAFASTLPALRQAGFGGDLDPMAMLEFLEFGFVSDGRCIRQGVRKLPPGHVLTWTRRGSREEAYWTLPSGQFTPMRFEEAVEETERLLLEAVRLRLEADVPIAVLLSGGVDSGLVCWALAKLNTNIQAFTVGVPDKDHDETAAALRTAQRLGIEHRVVGIEDSLDCPFALLTNAYGEPFASTSALGVLQVSQAMKAHVRVVMTGDGGDDLFIGYPNQLYAWKAQRLAETLPDAVRHGVCATQPLLRMLPGGRRAANFLSYVQGGIGAYMKVRDGLPLLQERGVLGPMLDSLTLPERNVLPDPASAGRLVDDLFHHHIDHHFRGEFLPKVDGGTMYWSLEARSPMLDQQLWEFGCRLPYGLRLRNGEKKAILREIARRHLGADVADRRKQGFSVPVENWLLTRWRADLERLRNGSAVSRQGWTTQRGLKDLVDHSIREGAVPEQVWRLAVLEAWLRSQDSAGDP